MTLGFKKGSGTVAGTARRVLRTTVPDPFLNHAEIGIAFEIARGSALECAATQDVLVVGKSLDRRESQQRKTELDRMAAMLSRLGGRAVFKWLHSLDLTLLSLWESRAAGSERVLLHVLGKSDIHLTTKDSCHEPPLPGR